MHLRAQLPNGVEVDLGATQMQDLFAIMQTLSSLVEHGLGMNAFANAVFVFGNRRRDRIKILGWDRNGFWLLQKRLEEARFIWPRKDSPIIDLSVQQLHWLLEGIDLAAMRGHAAVIYQKAA